MNAESLKSILADIAEVRARMRASPRLQLEFKACISKLMREHSVEIDDQTLAAITIAIYPELSTANVMVEEPLPVPDLGPAPR